MSDYNWEALAAPFDESELEWRPGYVFEDRDDPLKGNALALPYIQNRAVMDRLDLVIGHANWRNEFTPAPQGGVLCTLYIRLEGEWVGKQDAAENTDFESVKGGISDSMKRAAVQWSIGRYLYNLPMINHPVKRSDAKAKNWKFVGTPKLPTGSSSNKHLDDQRPTSALGTHEKPAQPRSAKVERPLLIVDDLVKWLQAEAKTAKGSDKVIDAGMAANIAREMGKFISGKDQRHFLLWLAWEVKTSNELTDKQFNTCKLWLDAKATTLEHEAKLVEDAYAKALEQEASAK